MEEAELGIRQTDSVPMDSVHLKTSLREFRKTGLWSKGLAIEEGAISQLLPGEFRDLLLALSENLVQKVPGAYLGESTTRLCELLKRTPEEDGTAESTQDPQHIITFESCMAFNELLRKCAADPLCVVPSETIQQIYEMSHHDDPEIRRVGPLFWKYLSMLDSHNSEHPFGLEDKIYQQIQEALDDPSSVTREELGMMFRFVDNIPAKLVNMCYAALGEATDDDAILTIFSAWSNKVSLPYARMLLRTYAKSHEWEQEKLAHIENVLRINEGMFHYKSLPELYKSIDFGETYGPNAELQDFEDDLLHLQFHNSKKVLDVGCGDGRLMRMLKSDKRHVVGIDIVKEHLEKAKKLGEDVVMASWYETPFADKTFDGMYCLGRSFLHNITEIDQFRMLLEMNRILQMGSDLVIDLPNTKMGDYAYESERMVSRAHELGIWNSVNGFMNDGPDPHHRFDRTAPDEDLIATLADTCGFTLKKLARHEYEGSRGKNENIYWKLTKVRDLHPYVLDLLTEMNVRSRVPLAKPSQTTPS